MFELFVGDISSDLADHARQYDQTAVLIEDFDYQHQYNGTAYSSLGDINDAYKFWQLCNKADVIHYVPPLRWSDTVGNKSVQQDHTESILVHFSQIKNVTGLESIKSRYAFLSELAPAVPRSADISYIWAVGCSISHGVGVAQDQAWPTLVSLSLDLPLIKLTQPGSSIIWASNQICQNDIRPGDIVFWGLTVQNRLDVIDRYNQIVHLNPGSYEKNHSLLNEFPIAILDNKSLIYHNVLAVRRAKQFCDKIGAKLIICGLTFDLDRVYTHYKVPNFRQIMCYPISYKDFGSDGSHPGPIQHKEFANSFLEIYKTCK